MTAVTIFVCVSCRRRLGEDDESFDQPGRGLADAIEARLHQAHDQGLPVWRERPDHIRKNTVARVPPMQMIKE